MQNENLVPVPHERGPDGGPLYTETPPEIRSHQPYPGTIAEPWNAATAFLFVVIVLVWLVRLRGRLHRHPFMATALPILFVGGVGGTLYHGLRTWRGYFLMDVIPIFLLGLAVSVYIWIRLGPKLRYLVGMIAVVAMLQLTGQFSLPLNVAITMSYSSFAIVLLVPLSIALVRTRFRYFGWIATALVSFAFAIFFRLADAWEPPLLPMGTHWLWHTFGAITTAALSEYVYRLEGVNLRNAPSTTARNASSGGRSEPGSPSHY